MSRTISYDRVVVEVAAGLVDQPIAITFPVLEFRVPSSTVNASVKFGSKGAKSVNLTPGGRNRFSFCGDPPSQIFLTAPGGDPIEVFGSSEVEPAFFPFASDAGVAFEAVATYPEQLKLMDGNAVVTGFGFNTDGANGQCLDAKAGGGSDAMELVDGRICYHMITAIGTEVLRKWAVGFPIQIPLTQMLRTGQSHDEFGRVYWDTFWMKCEGVPTTPLRTGIRYGFWSDPGGFWYNDLNCLGWGVAVSDDGGGLPELHYAANRLNPGIGTPDEDLNLGILMNVWRRLDVLHIAPTQTRRARLLIYVDGSLVIEREWGSGSGNLPDYQGAAGSIDRRVQCGASVVGANFSIGGIVVRRGCLLFTGAMV